MTHGMCSVDRMPFFFFKQKTAYEMRISDWSSDVCSSDLNLTITVGELEAGKSAAKPAQDDDGGKAQKSNALGLVVSDLPAARRKELRIRGGEIGRASCRERVCQYV